MKNQFIKKRILSGLGIQNLLFFTVWMVLGCSENNASKRVELQEHLMTHSVELVKNLTDQQDKMNQRLSVVSRQVFPANPIATEFQVVDVDIQHQVQVFRESLQVSASLIPHSIPVDYHFQQVMVYINYSIALPQLDWKESGVWSGIISTSQGGKINFQVLLPELEMSAEEAVVEFDGLGMMPLLPLTLSQEISIANEL